MLTGAGASRLTVLPPVTDDTTAAWTLYTPTRTPVHVKVAVVVVETTGSLGATAAVCDA